MSTSAPPDQRALLQRAFIELKELRARLDEAERAHSEPIAIVGLACRMPLSPDARAFWRLLHDGVDAVRAVPPDRAEVLAFQASLARSSAVSKIVGAFLDDADAFDAGFFGISPREATCMDPQQRLFLEVAWEALEDAAIPKERLAGNAVGVFVGVHSQSSDYFLLQTQRPATIDSTSATGTAHSVLAGRLSYWLDLRGPSLAVDTACSSSLVALHLACASLRARECDAAIAGGVNLRLSPAFFLVTSRMGTGSSGGRCRVFDASADGVVTGEGCGVVVLKRLDDALRDGDRIHALVRGSAVNQDGTSAGLAAPNVQAQKALLRRALDVARVSEDQIGYLETHGTGTSLGDPIEVEALAEAIGVPAKSKGSTRCALGAVKSNVGHLEGAAGIAGVVKAVLALENEVIPPNLHFTKLNPHIALDGTPFVIPTAPLAWPRGEAARFAGVSAFGWSGTNAHVVLEEAPPRTVAAPVTRAGPRLLPISARTPEALPAMARRYAEHLAGEGARDSLDAIATTAAIRRTHHAYRLAVCGESHAAIAEALFAAASGEPHASVSVGKQPTRTPRVVFVFPGQGSQWVEMGRELFATDAAFREVIEQCDHAFRAHSDVSLIDEIQGSATPSRFADIDVIQPMLFAIEVALAAVWRAHGVVPDAVIGHSMGEVAAAYVAGVLTLDDAARIICRRSRLLRRVRGSGAMAVVERTMEEAARIVAPFADRVSIAASNSARSTVLAGDRDALASVLARLEADGVFCRWVNVDVASHSPQVDPVKSDLRIELATISPRKGSIPIYSTVRGAFADGASFDPGYWVDNLRLPVLFHGGVRELAAKHDVFVEMSPHPVLLPAIDETLEAMSSSALSVPTLRREQPERATFLASLGALYTRGVTVDWERVLGGMGGRPPVPLPSYAWQHQRYWIDRGASTSKQGRDASPSGHPILEAPIASSAQPGTWIAEARLGIAELPFLGDHRVGGAAVFPAAGYIDLALAAASDALRRDAWQLESVAFDSMLVVPDDGQLVVQCVVAPQGSDRAEVRIASRPHDANGDVAWTRHATAVVRLGPPGEAPTRDRARIEEVCGETTSADAHYTRMAAFGVAFGPAFRAIERIARRDGEAIARVRLPDAVRAAGYRVHPALLDACFQTMAATRTARAAEPGETWLPVGLESLTMYAAPGELGWAHVKLRGQDDPSAREAACDIALFDDDGRVVAIATGLTTRRLEGRARAEADPIDRWLYALRWVERSLQSTNEAPRAPRDWLLFADDTGVGEAVATRLRARGDRVTMHAHAPRTGGLDPRDAAAIRRAIAAGVWSDVASFWALDEAPPADDAPIALTQALATTSALHVAQALAQVASGKPPRLWLVTSSAQAVSDSDGPRDGALRSLLQSPVWGLARTIALEHPELACTRIDIGAEPQSFVDAIARELAAQDREDQIALRAGARFVARLVRAPGANEAVATSPARNRAFRLEIRAPGALDRLALYPMRPRDPGPGEVALEVLASGLNFADVLLALGAIPDDAPGARASSPRLGGEGVGRVIAVGSGVGLTPGQIVMGVIPESFATHAIVPATFLVPKPAHLTIEDAASLPIAFLTAYVALYRVARLARGERVLIHAATGGVGLAAVQLAKRIGAEVYATAGSEEKRAFLRAQGVAHVANSRSLDFARDVMEATAGEGVDVVLNSLAGPFIDKGITLLRSHGRFVEIGKVDAYADRPLGMRPFLRNLTFTLVDLLRMRTERPAEVQRFLSEVVALFEARELVPIPREVFPIARAEDAFRKIAQARHIGKAVVTFEGCEDAPILATHDEAAGAVQAIESDGTYLITGGMGGLGLKLAAWLVDKGAKSIVLVGRSGPSPAASKVIDALAAQGARVIVSRVDVSRRADVRALLDGVRRELPPLRGVFHCAVALDDATLAEQSAAKLLTAMAPKLDGAWNLHLLTADDPLACFVMFSSAAALLGAPGQANYAAANAFLDALAHARRRAGLPALSINWGPWAEVGLAAAQANRGERLAYRGLESLAPELGLHAVDVLLARPTAQIGVLPLNLRQWRQFYPKATALPLFEDIAAAQNEDRDDDAGRRVLAERLRTASDGERLDMIEAHIVEHAARVLRLPTARVDRDTEFRALGFDSLMALELRNRLEASLGLTLPGTLIWAHPTISALGVELLVRAGLAAKSAPATEANGPSPARDAAALERALDAVDQLSDDEALRALVGQ
jgi:acyl transferase domain-containing protein/NADP-dependent 3-hydroxy acid dehydrogenase YdfG/acyl carrier protein